MKKIITIMLSLALILGFGVTFAGCDTQDSLKTEFSQAIWDTYRANAVIEYEDGREFLYHHYDYDYYNKVEVGHDYIYSTTSNSQSLDIYPTSDEICYHATYSESDAINGYGDISLSKHSYREFEDTIMDRLYCGFSYNKIKSINKRSEGDYYIYKVTYDAGAGDVVFEYKVVRPEFAEAGLIKEILCGEEKISITIFPTLLDKTFDTEPFNKLTTLRIMYSDEINLNHIDFDLLSNIKTIYLHRAFEPTTYISENFELEGTSGNMCVYKKKSEN